MIDKTVSLNVPLLEKLLTDAEYHHRDYEHEIGQPKEDWPVFYAKFIMSRLNDIHATPPESAKLAWSVDNALYGPDSASELQNAQWADDGGANV